MRTYALATAGLATIGIFTTGCLGIGGAKAWYPARQPDVLDATVTAFQHFNIPATEVTDDRVLVKDFTVTNAWTNEQIRDWLQCSGVSQRSSFSSVVVSISATVRGDLKETGQRRPPGGGPGITNLDTSLNLNGNANVIADGSQIRCTISPAFTDVVIDRVSAITGVPSRRTVDKTGRPLPDVPGRTRPGGN